MYVYDDEQDEKFMVAPICCTTYHYAVKVFNLPNITIISIGHTAYIKLKGF